MWFVLWCERAPIDRVGFLVLVRRPKTRRDLGRKLEEGRDCQLVSILLRDGMCTQAAARGTYVSIHIVLPISTTIQCKIYTTLKVSVDCQHCIG